MNRAHESSHFSVEHNVHNQGCIQKIQEGGAKVGFTE